MNLTQKRIMVTGGSGFLGRYLVSVLQQQGCNNIFIPRRKDYDLTQMDNVIRAVHDGQPQGQTIDWYLAQQHLLPLPYQDEAR